MAPGNHPPYCRGKIRRFLRGLSLALAVTSLMGCKRQFPEDIPPKTTSKDFWIDRCDITYRGKPFPITGTIEEMIHLLGPHSRLDSTGLEHRYFWDDLGVNANLAKHSKTLVASVELHYAHGESFTQRTLKRSDHPEAKKLLAEVKAGTPTGIFKGEVVLEGAVIGPIIDFMQVNLTRLAYLKSQSGPDAGLDVALWHSQPGYRPILHTYSLTNYAFERFCVDGRHRKFDFTLISAERPFRLQSLSIGSNDVPDTVAIPGTLESSTLKHHTDPVGPK